MADKEIVIDHSKISGSQNITPAMDREFKARGLDLHRHEVTSLNDDFKSGKRIITVKNVLHFGQMSEKGKQNYGNIKWDSR